MKPRLMMMLLAAAALLIGTQVQAQEGPTLRWNLKKGQKFTVVSINDSKSVIEMPMGKQEMPSKITTTSTWEVVESSNGDYKMKNTVDRIQVEMSTPFAEIDFDSDEKDSDGGGIEAQMTASFKQLVGKSTTVEFNSRGIVKKKEKKDDDESEGAQGMMMGEDMTSQMFFELPEKAVSKGDSWKQKIEHKSDGGSMTMNNEYTYAGKTDSATTSIHEIKIKGDLDMDMEQNGIVMELDEGSVEGKMYFDAKAGYLSKVDMTQTMIMQMEAGGQAMTNSMTSKVKVSIELAK